MLNSVATWKQSSQQYEFGLVTANLDAEPSSGIDSRIIVRVMDQNGDPFVVIPGNGYNFTAKIVSYFARFLANVLERLYITI